MKQLDWLEGLDPQCIFDLGAAAEVLCDEEQANTLGVPVVNLLTSNVRIIDFFKADSCDEYSAEERDRLMADLRDNYSLLMEESCYDVTRVYSRFAKKPASARVTAENVWDFTSDGKNHNTFIWVYNEKVMLGWNCRAGVWLIRGLF